MWGQLGAPACPAAARGTPLETVLGEWVYHRGQELYWFG